MAYKQPHAAVKLVDKHPLILDTFSISNINGVLMDWLPVLDKISCEEKVNTFQTVGGKIWVN